MHTCPNCGHACYCHGDIDDIDCDTGLDGEPGEVGPTGPDEAAMRRIDELVSEGVGRGLRLVRRLRCFFGLVWRPSTHPPVGMTKWQVRITIPLAWNLACGFHENLPNESAEETVDHE